MKVTTSQPLDIAPGIYHRFIGNSDQVEVVVVGGSAARHRVSQIIISGTIICPKVSFHRSTSVSMI